MNAYILGLKRYFDFKGRTTRAQYWQFVLVLVVLLLTAAFIDAIFTDNPLQPQRTLTLLVGVTHFMPFLACSVRRLHDTDRSGWWYLVNAIPLGQIIFIALCCIPSTPGYNRYGAPVESEEPGTSWSGNSFGQVPREPVFEPADGLGPSSVSSSPKPIAPRQVASVKASPAPRIEAQAPGLSVASLEQLERLAALRSSGVITETEFATLKGKILPST